MKEKNEELAVTIEKMDITKAWKSSFTMNLKGIIDAAVNGGVQKYKEAFFTEEFDKLASEEEKRFVPKLREELEKQLKILERGLAVHSKICPDNMVRLHQQLEVQLATMKDDTKGINLHNRELKRTPSLLAQQELLVMQAKEEQTRLDTNL